MVGFKEDRKNEANLPRLCGYLSQYVANVCSPESWIDVNFWPAGALCWIILITCYDWGYQSQYVAVYSPASQTDVNSWPAGALCWIILITCYILGYLSQYVAACSPAPQTDVNVWPDGALCWIILITCYDLVGCIMSPTFAHEHHRLMWTPDQLVHFVESF